MAARPVAGGAGADFERSGFPACGECAGDIARFMAETPGLVFAQGGNTIYISQYVPCKADFKINDVNVHITMDTKWPYGGLVDIKVQTDKQVTFGIKFRRPAWCKQVFYQHDLEEQEHSSDFVGSEAGWGNLPEKDREKALQDIGRDFPSHYREVIEEYFRRLAAEQSDGGR